VLGALRETETALATYAENHDRHAALDEALASARTASDQARRLREAGRAAIINDIGGRQGVIGAEAAVLNSRAEIANDQINLFLALGGGW
jgi:outer membrane protein TolC